MTQVRILKATYAGKPLRPGDVVDVDGATARRWQRNGIAATEAPEGEPEAGPEATGEEPEGEPADDKPKRGKRQASKE